jgi:hypothetical protein
MSIGCLKSPRAKANRQRIHAGHKTAGTTRKGMAFVSASVRTGEVKSCRPERRKRIDPTTCERDYQPEELEFMRAIEHYKRTSGRMFPTCSELLEVVRGLGYVRSTTA